MIYSPAGTVWNGASHQFLLYTRDNGSQEVVRGGPEHDQNLQFKSMSARSLPHEEQLQASRFGRLAVSIGPYDITSPDWPALETDRGVVFDQATFDSYYKQTLKEGPDAALEGTWTDIKKHATEIDAQGHIYAPTGPNSNSLASESVRRAGLDAPNAENGHVFGLLRNVMPWAPGAGDRLETPQQISERQLRESEAALERRPVGNLLASLKLVEAEPVNLAPQRDVGLTQPKAHGIGFGD